jgi:predicted RNA-binding Zn ribbon-like protein
VPAADAAAAGGPPAPDPLHLVQSLANTLSPGTDVLGTREEAIAWLRAAALLPGEAGLSNSEHAALLRMRDSVRDVVAAHTGGLPDDEAAARLTRALADGRVVVTLDQASAVHLASAARASYPNLVAAIAVAVAESAAAGTWSRLKSCAAPGCGLAFYDDSGTAAATRCAAHAPDHGA